MWCNFLFCFGNCIQLTLTCVVLHHVLIVSVSCSMGQVHGGRRVSPRKQVAELSRGGLHNIPYRPPPPPCAQTLSPHTQKNGVNIFQGRGSLVNPLSCFLSLLHIRAAGKKNQFQHFIFTSIPKVSLPEWFQKSGNQWTSLEQLKTQCNIFVSVWWCCCERRKPGTDFF